jgi:glycosyltransferase involved in cell wall biosynthesis
MAQTLVSLITCTLGRKDKLERLLQSLLQQNREQFELILIDQNPPGFLTDVVAPYLQYFSIVHVHTAKGLSLGRNAGLRIAKGDLVAFPDDDCWYPPQTIQHVMELFAQQPKLAFVTGCTRDASDIPSLSPSLEYRVAISRANYLNCGNSNSIFARLQAVRELGGFDERLGVGATTPFQSGEESDLVLSAIKAQMQLAYFPELVVHHDQVVSSSRSSYVSRARQYGAGYGALLHKHQFGNAYFASRVLRSVVRSGLHVLQLQWTEARYKIAWAMGIWSGYWGWSMQVGVSAWAAEPDPGQS